MKIQHAYLLPAFLAFTTVAAAQTKPGRFGIGVSLSPTLLVADGDVIAPPGARFYLPMNLHRSFRLEPEIGYSSSSTDAGDGIDNFKGEVSAMTLSLGALFLFSVDDDFQAYVGPRIGINKASESFEFGGAGEESFKRTDLTIGVALGGEHFFSSHFSLGAEARFTRISAGEPEIKPNPGTTGKFEATGMTTDGLVFVRWFF